VIGPFFVVSKIDEKWAHSGCQGFRLLWGRFSLRGGLLARFEATQKARVSKVAHFIG